MMPGEYKTDHGSTVTVHTQYASSWTARFDWFEEPNACIECREVNVDHNEYCLTWECEHCGGGYAKLGHV